MHYKAAGEATVTDDGAGFVGYASTWTREPDCYGDVVAKGAFSRTLKEWEKRKAPIPVLWGHRMDEPGFFIGHVREAVEDDHGLKVTCALDEDSDNAQHVRRLLKTGTVGQMSFAFDIREDATVELKGRHARELRDLDLYEVSVVPIGANQDTSIEAVKAQPTDALTPEEIAKIRELLAREEDVPEEGEPSDDTEEPSNNGSADGNTEPDDEAVDDGKASSPVEAAAQLNNTITALLGQEGATA